MCGLVALARTNHAALIDPELVKEMTHRLTHRGPDDEGFYFSEFVAFGFRRLAILDLSEDGHQPMSTPDGKIWVVFNGEIYNYLELRQELSQLGYTFRSGTDTEVILCAYQEWGMNCLQLFNGMWGICLWDENKQKLFCARDRLGIKPLYYHWHEGQLALASEIKALLLQKSIHPQLNQSVAFDFLVLSLSDHTDQTSFLGINQLLPGHCLTFDVTTGQLYTEAYWQLRLGEQNDISGPEAALHFARLFEDSVRLRLRSDVPVGSCLSGGLDSSAIVCTINNLLRLQSNGFVKAIGERQRTFTADFPSSPVSERHYADAVLMQTKTRGYFVEPAPEGFWHELPQFAYHQDMPFHTTSVYAQWVVMRLAKQSGITVILDGQGADELLAGYTGYLGIYLAGLLAKGQMAAFWHNFRVILGNTDKGIGGLLRIVGRGWVRGSPNFYKQFAWKNARYGLRWLNSKFYEDQKARLFIHERGGCNLQAALVADMSSYNLPALLRYEDRNSMAFSLEARLPFLDYKLVEFVTGLPEQIKLARGLTKSVMRQALHDTIPQAVLQRKDKKGFLTPQQLWLESGRDQIRELFQTNPRSTKIVNTQAIVDRIEDSRPLTDVESTELWRFISFEQWLRTFDVEV